MPKVCSVTLELLRKGPPHNQLLSPLTDYLALCGNNGASVVQIPYEHQDFLRKLKELHYPGTGNSASVRRQAEIHKTAEEMGNVLSSISGLAAELCNTPNANGTITHLSLVLSAAELSLLPFELAKIPNGSPGGAGNWLLLQTLAPICLTRRVRSVSNKSVYWPRKPRILFVAASPQGLKEVPFAEHTDALFRAIMPWLRPFNETSTEDLQEKVSEIMTILPPPDATIEAITDACLKQSYTHVHILAHGMEDPTQEGKPYGIALHSRYGPEKIDVVSGSRLATALRPLREKQGSDEQGILPVVVTVASCDSGYVKDVTYNSGASFAHELHQAGIPFVVASQFPLTFDGSIHMTEVLYEKLLMGDDPRIALHQLRGKLYAHLGSDTHDWASLVAYAAFPDNLEEQLVDVQYARARDAIEAAMKHVDRAVDAMKDEKVGPAQELEPLLKRVDQAANRMPIYGGYETEGLGMLASTEKRKAQALYRASWATKINEKQSAVYRQRCIDALRESLHLYTRALADNMSNSRMVVRNKRSVHWAIVQYLSLRAVLGEPFLAAYWDSAIVSIELDLNFGDHETRAYAHSSGAELYLLLLAYAEKDMPQRQDISVEEVRKKAHYHATALRTLSGHDSFEVYGTRRQFERYVDWWAMPEFEKALQDKCGIQRIRNWSEKDGLKDLAADIVRSLPKSDKWM